eukprot:CAMPEP_0119298576 /NCGR_PEP_ID=MMETSP1333-20130426/740_1 /TAXON_ID=418940 /ORGANISM="Scyphosphaera apsteinii, Strain RCC1455" /LENGTH=326 /DNA_ID=CAMNT_0007299707 /DNA_START=125 /DNA_END=1101 /DNA_ORIENTATION=+
MQTYNAPHEVPPPLSLPSIMFLTNGCGGSSFLIRAFLQLLVLHNVSVRSPHDCGFNSANGYEIFRVGRWDLEMLQGQCDGGTLLFKVMLDRDISRLPRPPLFNYTEEDFLARIRGDVRIWAAFRCNKLDQLACKVSDCFHNYVTVSQYSVDTMGSRSYLCHDRRRKGANRTFVVLDPNYLNLSWLQDIKARPCEEEWRDARKVASIAGIHLPLQPLFYEDLVAFEYDSELMPGQSAYPGTSLAERSIRAWMAALLSVGIAPQRQVVSNYLMPGRSSRRVLPSAERIWNAEAVHQEITRQSQAAQLRKDTRNAERIISMWRARPPSP